MLQDAKPVPGLGPPDARDVAQLIVAAEAGDQAAWEALVRRFSGLVWAIARAHLLSRDDAAEVIESVWLALVENLGCLGEPAGVGAWLAAVTRRQCLSRATWAGGVGEVDPGVLADERRATLWRAFEGLSVEGRLLMILLMFEPRLSYAEIATIMDVPVGTIGPLWQRCMHHLRNGHEISTRAS